MSQVGWLNAAITNTIPPPVTAKQRVVIIPRDGPEEGINCSSAEEIPERDVTYYLLCLLIYH